MFRHPAVFWSLIVFMTIAIIWMGYAGDHKAKSMETECEQKGGVWLHNESVCFKGEVIHLSN